MDLGLKDKVALVTDCTNPIGLAIAKSFGAEGASVVASGADAEKVQRAADELRQRNVSAVGVCADITVPADVKVLVDKAIAHFGRLDIVVNTAGTDLRGRAEEVPAERVEDLLKVKVLGPWELARRVAPHLRKQGSGRFIMVISDAGKIPGKSVIASAVAGAAQHAFVKSLSDDLGADNVLVSAVSIGHIGPPSEADLAIEGEQYLSRSLEQQESGWGRHVPLGRWGDPEDVADAVVFLASANAGFICGSNIDVDGGDQRSIL